MPGARAEVLLRTVAGGSHPERRTDAELLAAFVATRDGAAFEALVRRHGPMVMGVCRRVLGRRAEAEDAFQAAFLVLARKAGAVAGCVGGYLHTTTLRVALRVRAAVARRTEREQPVNTEPPTDDPTDDLVREEILADLDREIRRLPEKYRTAVVLCELQGRPRAEAARELGIAEGTLSSRLAAARKLLARRLARHHPAVAAGGLGCLLSADAARAFPAPALVRCTVLAAGPFAAGHAVVPGLSPSVRSLAEGVLSHMLATKLAAAVAVTAALLAGLGGAHLLAGPGDTPVALAAPQAKTPEEPKPQPKTDDAKKPDAKQPDPKTPEPKKEPAAALKARLKKHQDEIAKIRDAMLAEVAAEEKRLDEVIAKAQKEYDEATKNRDFTNASKIFRGLSEARGEKTQVQQLRADIERRIRPVDPPPPPRPPEERLGLRTSPPSSVVVAQLGLKSGEGLVIDSVKADSPAAKLGLQSADILLSVDGKAVPTSAPAFQKLLTELKPGAAVDAVVLRKGKQETIKGFAVPAPQE